MEGESESLVGGKSENPFDLFWVMAKWREGWCLAQSDESGSESEDFACVLASTAHAMNENKAKWFAKQLASESIHSKHPRNKTTLPSIQGISHTKDCHKMCGRPKFFKVPEISKKV